MERKRSMYQCECLGLAATFCIQMLCSAMRALLQATTANLSAHRQIWFDARRQAWCIGVPVAGERVDGRSGRWSAKWVGRASVQVDSVRETVTSREEVRPMNAVTVWVLPLVFTVRRLTWVSPGAPEQGNPERQHHAFHL